MQRRHKKREGKVERDTARVFYMRLSPVRLKIQFKAGDTGQLRACSLSDLSFTMCSTGGWVHAALPLSVGGTPSLARCRDILGILY